MDGLAWPINGAGGSGTCFGGALQITETLRLRELHGGDCIAHCRIQTHSSKADILAKHLRTHGGMRDSPEKIQ